MCVPCLFFRLSCFSCPPIHNPSGVITRYLCWVAAAQQLPPASVVGLLEGALQVGDAVGLSFLLDDLPGASQLDMEQAAKLLTVRLPTLHCTPLR